MRVANAPAICAVSAIAVQGLTAPVSASPNSPFPPPALEADSFIVQPLSAATPAELVSLAPPAIVGGAQTPASAYGTQDSTEIGNYQDPLKYIALPAPRSGTGASRAMSPGADFLIPAAVAPEWGDPLDFIVQPRVGAAAVSAAPVMPPPAYASSAQLLKPLPQQPVGMATAAGASSNLAQNLVAMGQAPVSLLPEVPPPPPSAQPAQNQPPPGATPSPQPAQNQPASAIPSQQEIEKILNQLDGLQDRKIDFADLYKGSPGLTVANPSGFGADNNTGYIGVGFQSRVRYADALDGGTVLGAGFGDAVKSVGVEVSYTLASITGGNTEFGRGGLNLKVHRQFPQDWAVAVGWNGFLNIGANDVTNSFYGVATKVFRLREDINSSFSRVAVTAGLGNGQFRSEEDIANDRSAVNLFGSVAVRAAEPVSLIAEWTGQDLTLGASIVPFKNVPVAITPALRDVAGAGDGARFVIGVGYSFNF